MSSFQQKLTSHAKRKENHLIKQASEPDFYGRDVVGIIRPGIKIFITNKSRTLMKKMDNMQQKMSNINKEMETLRKN